MQKLVQICVISLQASPVVCAAAVASVVDDGGAEDLDDTNRRGEQIPQKQEL